MPTSPKSLSILQQLAAHDSSCVAAVMVLCECFPATFSKCSRVLTCELCDAGVEMSRC